MTKARTAKTGLAAALAVPIALAVVAGVPGGVSTAAADPVAPNGCVPAGAATAGAATASTPTAAATSSPSTAPNASAATPAPSGTPSPATAAQPVPSGQPIATPSAGGSQSSAPAATTTAPAASKPTPTSAPTAPATSLPPCPASPHLTALSQHREARWQLTASTSTMYGLTYNGVVTVQTAAGPVEALDFTADSADLVDMLTWAPISGSTGVVHNDAGKGKTTHLTGVHLHVTKLAGDMFGLIPSSLTPTSPPPLIPGVKTPIPVFFTNVSQDNLQLDAKTLSVPGYTVSVTGF